MAVNSYRSVVYANEENSDARTAVAYIREKVRQHDALGAVEVVRLDGISTIRMSEGDDYYLYIYEMDGYLMELEAKEGSGVTADFGNKIMEIGKLSFDLSDNLLVVETEDNQGNRQTVDIAIKSEDISEQEVVLDEK